MTVGDIKAPELYGPFRGSQAISERIVTPKQLRSPLFVRLFRDVYLPAAMPVTHDLRCRAAALVLPEHAVLTGHSAASIYGLNLASPADPVELVVREGEHFRPHPGMNVRRVFLLPDEHIVRQDIRVATPDRMALDLLFNTKLRKSLGAAVAALDVVLRHGLVDLAALRDLVSERRDHGVVRARHAVALADPRAESVPESLLRVLLTRAGIAVTPQVEVCCFGRFVGRVDLAVDGSHIAVEYDGQWHDTPEQAHADRVRRTRLDEAGWHVIVVRKAELQENPEGVVRTVLEALRAQNARPNWR